MKKFFKKMAMLVGVLSVFLMATTTYATLRCPEDGDAYIKITHGDKEISNGSLTGTYAYTKVGPVYFQDVDATKMIYQTISTPNGINLSNYSMWGHNNPANSSMNGIGNGSLKENSIKWFRNDNTYGGVFMKYNSRIIIRRLYQVTPGGKFSIVTTQGNGMPTDNVKACVGQYDANGKFLDDGAWHDSSIPTDIHSNTKWIIPIMRYNNGSNDVGSGTNKTIGWGPYDTDLSEYYVYYVFNPFKYTKDYGYDNKKEIVYRWGVSNVSDSFTNPTRTGYTFKGWKITDANGNVVQIINSAGKVVNQNSACITRTELVDNNVLNGKIYYEKFFQNLTFTAQWEPNAYTLTIQPNGGSMRNGDNLTSSDFSIGFRYMQKTYMGNIASGGGYYSSNAPTRTGYTFTGFKFSNGTGGLNTSGSDFYFGNNIGGGHASTKDTYIFNGDHAGNVTATAQWTANSYKLTFNANGGTLKNPGTNLYNGTNTNSVTVTYDSGYYYEMKNDIPTRTGYTFAGWYTSPTGGTKVYGADGYAIKGTSYWNNSNHWVYTGDLTVYAHWTPNRVNLDYRASGGSINSSTYYVNSNGQIVRRSDNNVYFHSGTYGTDFAPMTPSELGLSRTGYTFSKWRVHSTGTKLTAGTKYNPTLYAAWNDANVNVSNATGFNSVLWAEWTPNSYTVTYNANGGTGSMANSTATYNSAFITRQNTFTKKGHTFAGWNEKADGTGTAWDLTGTGVYESGRTWTWTYTNNITLYAQWVPNTYTVSYNANGGTGSMEDSSIVYGKDFITRQNTFTKTGYVFNGWNEKADGTGVAWKLISPGVYESGKTWPYTYDCNITLYAQWVDTSAPEITHTYKEGNCNTEQSFNITIKDSGSGIKSYTISGAGVTATSGSLTYSNTGEAPLKNITVGVTVKDAGELKITATDFVDNTASSSITFIKTFLDNNQSHIAGPNRLATGNKFSSVAGGTCHPYTINTYGETVTPGKSERKGCDNGGWSVNNFAMSGSNSITTNGGTYYVVWKDTLAPKVTVRAEEVDNTEWKLTLDIYDATSTGASTYAGSDVAGYYIGGNSDYMKNTYYAVECNADGSATNVEVNVKPGEMPTIYINVADKAGNVSREGETVLEFKKVTLATRVTDSTSLAEFDYAGKKNLAVYTFYVLNGTRVDFPEARRIGYHGTSDPNKADKSTTWTTGAKDDVIGAKYAVINKDVVYYPTFVPNVYEITYEVNTPKDNSTITTPEMKEFTATNDTGLNMQANLTNPVKGYITYEGKAIAAEYVNDSSIPVGEINKKPEELAAKGWKFLGWYDNKAYTVKYDLTKTGNDIYTSEANKVYTEKCEADSSEYWNEYGWINNSDATLYAHWMVNKYIINYDMNAKDGDYCPNEGSKVEGKAETAAGDNRQIALCDTKVKLSGREDAGNTMVKVAESKETNYLLGLEVGIITEKEYVTVGELQSWSTENNARALEDQKYISKQIGATGTGKDAKFTDIGINITDGEEVTVYAVWDHAPIFERKSVSLLSDKLNEFKDGERFKYKEFSAYILSKVILIDPEDGMPETIETEDWKETKEVSIVEGMLSTALDTYVYTLDRKDNGAIKLTFIDIEETVSQLLTYTTNASCQIKVDIEDTYGNVTRDEITIYFQSSIANEDIKTGVDESTLFTRTHYTRAINKYFFEQSLLDTTDWSNYRDLGALRPTSVWVNDPEYRELLSTTLNNLEEGKYIVSYHFTRDEVLATQMYTYGKATYDEIVERYSVAKAETIKAMLKGKYTEEGHRITTINETGEGSVEEVLGAYNELFKEWGVIKK